MPERRGLGGRTVRRIYGEPPPPGSRRSVRLAYVRRFYSGSLLMAVPASVLFVLWGSSVAFVLLAAAWWTLLIGLTTISLQIRAAHRRERHR
jgi:predicted MFS family arabinose efflux permease